KFNRVIMNLPGEAYKYLAEACQLSAENATIHYYCFARGKQPEKQAAEDLLEKLASLNRSGEILEARLVREVAPRTWQVAVDFKIKP
ncbi:MAG: class I SAM-dependent methyltransferase, partial [Candidatus Hecatellaceae archaeon]